ncbi:MAG: molybdenum cofactor guanylyltransferase [Bacteroidetes bacterium]|nr:molybdenum cofactor guanylyltransferase [Bacteroidota bacterium]MCL5026083.1 molybdenum cofactor guanylyltransferase [Chloroflexota bacterium]
MAYPPTSGIILAGGQSRRLGVDKTRLTLGRGKPLLAQVGQAIGSLCDELIVVANRQWQEVLPEAIWLPDAYPGMGSLGGIYTGLVHASSEHCLVVAGDMPFLSAPLLRYMLERPRDYDVLIPRFDHFFEPLHAIYGKNCLGPMRALIERQERKILDFFPEVRVSHLEEKTLRRLDPQLRSFFNVNTIEQLAEAWIIMLQDEVSA